MEREREREREREGEGEGEGEGQRDPRNNQATVADPKPETPTP